MELGADMPGSRLPMDSFDRAMSSRCAKLVDGWISIGYAAWRMFRGLPGGAAGYRSPTAAVAGIVTRG